MGLATRVDGVACSECGAEDVFMDVKDEASVFKIGARCHGCDHDFGVVGRVSRSDIGHRNEVYETGEEIVQERLGGGRVMGRTKSEAVAADAFEAYRDGDLRECIRTLVAYADRHVNNRKTAEVFRRAIDRELAEITGAVSRPDADAPRCVHCGSTCTFYRSDGDVACNDCPGIMPQEVDG